MKDTHNHPDHEEEFQILDEVTGSNNSCEVSIVNTTVDISDEEVLDILNYGLRLINR
jgi:hypothetical protein